MKLPLFALSAVACCHALASGPTPAGGNVLACETLNFDGLIRAGKLDMVRAPGFVKELGIPGISFHERYFDSFDDRYLDAVGAAVRSAGRVVTAFLISGDLVAAEGAGREQALEEIRRKMRAAARLGAPIVRIHLGTTGSKERDDVQGVECAIAAFRELLPAARALRVRISIENIAGVSWSAANILKIIRGTDPAWVGALIDFGNFAEDVRYQEIAALAPHAFSTHVKVNEFDARGEAAAYDLPRVLGILKKAGYKGALSIEYEGKGDRIEGVRKTRALLLKYWR